MAKRNSKDYHWCSGCREFTDQELTGKTEIIDRRKHKLWRCKVCGRINKICG